MTHDRERHHIAGRVHGDETVDLCVPCHRLVTTWQRAAGIDLRKNVDHTELARLRARLVGTALVGELMCRLYGRIISRVLDDGSWSPRPTHDRENRGD
jgi:hypothetical protein